jgi:nitrate/nitrite transport system substrate-binding protein
MNIPLPTDEMKSFKTTYDVAFDPNNIGAYLATTKK